MEDLRKYVQSARRDFEREPLQIDDLPNDPFDLFKEWFREAVDSGIPDPFAMSLATVNSDGQPSARVVYMRDFEGGAITFFTNYSSSKGVELANNPNACMNFFWPGLEHQVRFRGKVEKVGSTESDDYFGSRPRESQLGAWASNQSSELESRQQLIDRLEKFRKKFEGKDVPRPPHWGGYSLKPSDVEFWQGQPSRLHDRFLYIMHDGSWKKKRLFP